MTEIKNIRRRHRLRAPHLYGGKNILPTYDFEDFVAAQYAFNAADKIAGKEILEEINRAYDLKIEDDNLSLKNFRRLVLEKLYKYACSCSYRRLSSHEKTLRFAAEIFRLNDTEKEIIGFLNRRKLHSGVDRLSDAVFGFGGPRTNSRHLAELICCRRSDCEKALSYTADLYNKKIIEINNRGEIELAGNIAAALNAAPKTAEQFKNLLLGVKQKAVLGWEDFSHLGQDRDILCGLLQKAVQKGIKGINFLFYGIPGTGKTEFAKSLCRRCGLDLYSVGEFCPDDRSEPSRHDRLKALVQDTILLEAGGKNCLLFDEGEDIFCGRFPESYRNSKKFLNNLLENNAIPVIWTTNDIETMDKAFLRRFTYALQFETPTPEIRSRMWQKSLKRNKLPSSPAVAEDFARQYKLSPSFIDTAARSARLSGGGLSAVRRNLDVLEKAYHNGKTPPHEKDNARNFNPALLNTDTDLELLCQRLKKLPGRCFSLCLYGVSGTGKSAYARYLAAQLEMPVICKKASELLSMYVGGSEANIAAAFAEARENRAMLVFDEADSFLQERSAAGRSWEITQVNEMLTQMENHPLPFVCTTNLHERLDKASLRRFTFKVKYDYLSPQQRQTAADYFFGLKNLPLDDLDYLTPGDFSLVKNKAQILGVEKNRREITAMLRLEQENKNISSRRIGF